MIRGNAEIAFFLGETEEEGVESVLVAGRQALSFRARRVTPTHLVMAGRSAMAGRSTGPSRRRWRSVRCC